MSERHIDYEDYDGCYHSHAQKARGLLPLRGCLSSLRDEHPCLESEHSDFPCLSYSYYLFASLSMLQLPVGLLQEHPHLIVGRLREILVPPAYTIKWFRCHGTN